MHKKEKLYFYASVVTFTIFVSALYILIMVAK